MGQVNHPASRSSRRLLGRAPRYVAPMAREAPTSGPAVAGQRAGPLRSALNRSRKAGGGLDPVASAAGHQARRDPSLMPCGCALPERHARDTVARSFGCPHAAALPMPGVAQGADIGMNQAIAVGSHSSHVRKRAQDRDRRSG